jgi:microcystin-dependent protein
MASPFLAEIKIVPFGFAPRGWALCNGQLMPINQNQALFSLLGTTYGGDGRSNFGLPNLQARTPIHFGNGFTLGQSGGEQAHTLTTAELPTHVHAAYGSSASTGGSINPAGNYLGGANNLYHSATNLTSMVGSEVGNVGGSQSHPNMQPYLTLNFLISLSGIYPSRN